MRTVSLCAFIITTMLSTLCRPVQACAEDCYSDSGTSLSSLGSFPDGTTCICYPELETFTGNIEIKNSSTLELAIFPKLVTIRGSMSISSNAVLKTVSMGSLATVTNHIHIVTNPLLETVELSSLTTVDGYFYLGSSAAPQLDLSKVTSVGGYLKIGGNSVLVSVDMSSLLSTGGKLDIAGNGVLKTVSLGSLATVTSHVNIVSNPLLETVDLDSLTTVSVREMVDEESGRTRVGGGYFYVGLNPLLNSVGAAALGNLVSVPAGWFYFGQSAVPLLDLSKVTAVGGYLKIGGNSAMVSVDMSSLISTGGKLEISDNAVLKTLSMASLASVTSHIQIVSNPLLETVDICKLTSHGGLTLSGFGTPFNCMARLPALHSSCDPEGCETQAPPPTTPAATTPSSAAPAVVAPAETLAQPPTSPPTATTPTAEVPVSVSVANAEEASAFSLVGSLASLLHRVWSSLRSTTTGSDGASGSRSANSNNNGGANPNKLVVVDETADAEEKESGLTLTLMLAGIALIILVFLALILCGIKHWWKRHQKKSEKNVRENQEIVQGRQDKQKLAAGSPRLQRSSNAGLDRSAHIIDIHSPLSTANERQKNNKRRRPPSFSSPLMEESVSPNRSVSGHGSPKLPGKRSAVLSPLVDVGSPHSNQPERGLFLGEASFSKSFNRDKKNE